MGGFWREVDELLCRVPEGAAGTAAVPRCLLARESCPETGALGSLSRALVSGVAQARVELVSLPSAGLWGLADAIGRGLGSHPVSLWGGAGAAPQGLCQEAPQARAAKPSLLLSHFQTAGVLSSYLLAQVQV